ncbi:hypothetical protein D3C72_1112770 [compost metagenome]
MGACCIARRADAGDFGHHFIRCLAQSGQTVRMAGRQRHDHRMGTGCQGPFRPLEIGHQHRCHEARQLQRMLQHCLGIGQLWQQPGGHHGANLHFAHASGIGGIDPAAFLCSADDGGNALQAVAQAYLADSG